MAIKFEKIEAGMVLYERRRGSTGLEERPVKIISVNAAGRSATVSWNGNPNQLWGSRLLQKLFTWSYRDENVVVVRSVLGRIVSARKMTKAEIQARDTKEVGK